VIWLYGDTVNKLSPLAANLIREKDIYISPMIRLELQYLYEIGRLSSSPNQIIEYLANQANKLTCTPSNPNPQKSFLTNS
jgi:PIN domain nuclease of toxin-antitoxin system